MNKHKITDRYSGILAVEQSSDDILFTSASFEPRTTTITENLSEGYESDLGVIYVNKELKNYQKPEVTMSNINKLRSNLNKHCDDTRVVEGSYFEPAQQLEAIKAGLETVSRPDEKVESISIDVTTFNREVLFILLELLKSRYPNSTAQILYAQPEEYGDWLSRGFEEIRNMIGFTGLHRSARPTILIVLSGFESNRVLDAIDEFEPKKVELGWGSEATKEKFRSKNKSRQEVILNRQDTEEFEFSAVDIHSCASTVEGLIQNYSPDCNVVLAPMSTKLSTVGCWQAARKNLDTQVIYTLPKLYNYESYSAGAEAIYIDEIFNN